MKVTARKSTGGAESDGGVSPAGPHLFNEDSILKMPPRTGICRTCLITRPQNRLLGIFLHWTPPWKSRKSSDDCIANQIYKLTGVEIDKSDGFSQHICFPCFQNLKDAYTFYYRVRHHDNVMRSNQLLVRSPSLSMSKLIESWRMPEDEPDEEVIIPDESWKPTEMEQLQEVMIKQEVLSDYDHEPSSLLEPIYETIADIKIEPEELTPQSHSTVKLNGLTENPSTSKIVISSSYSVEPVSKATSKRLKNTSADKNIQVFEVAVKEELGSDSDDLDCDLSLDCMLCYKHFNTMSGLKAHVISSHSYKSVMRKRALISATFANHAEEKEPTSHQALSSCLECGKTFTTSESVDAHARIHKKSCEKCNKHFTSFVSLARHMSACTAQPAVSAPKRRTKTVQQLRRECAAEASEEEPAKRRKPTEQIYECSECKETFDEKLYLKIHNEVHHNASNTNIKSKKKESNGIEITETAENNIEVQNEMSSPGNNKAQSEADNLPNVLDTSKQSSYTIDNIESADKELLESILEPDTTDIDLGILAEEAKRSEIATSGPASIESVEQENVIEQNHSPASTAINEDNTIENKDHGQGMSESIEEETIVEKYHCLPSIEIVKKENPFEENYSTTSISTTTTTIQEHINIEKVKDTDKMEEITVETNHKYARAECMEEMVVKKEYDSTITDSMEVIPDKKDKCAFSIETVEEITLKKDNKPASGDSMKEIVKKHHDPTSADSTEVLTVKMDHGPSSIETMEEITVKKEHDHDSVESMDEITVGKDHDPVSVESIEKNTVEEVHGPASAESKETNTVERVHGLASPDSIEEENNTEKDNNHQSVANMKVKKNPIDKDTQRRPVSDELEMEIEEYETVVNTQMKDETDKISNYEGIRDKDSNDIDFSNDLTSRNDQVSHDITTITDTTIKNYNVIDLATSNDNVDKATDDNSDVPTSSDNVVTIGTASDNVLNITTSNDNDVPMSNDNAIDTMVENEEDDFELKLAFEDSQSPDLNKEISDIANSAILSDNEVCESVGQNCE